MIGWDRPARSSRYATFLCSVGKAGHQNAKAASSRQRPGQKLSPLRVVSDATNAP